jgi:hypothetical protein
LQLNADGLDTLRYCLSVNDQTTIGVTSNLIIPNSVLALSRQQQPQLKEHRDATRWRRE